METQQDIQDNCNHLYWYTPPMPGKSPPHICTSCGKTWDDGPEYEEMQKGRWIWHILNDLPRQIRKIEKELEDKNLLFKKLAVECFCDKYFPEEKKVHAIRDLRVMVGLSLREAKDLIDAEFKRRKIPPIS